MAFSPQPHLWNRNLDLQYLPRCLTCCCLLKMADPSSGEWELAARSGVVLGNGRRNVWINDLRCILASATFSRIHHAEVAWVVSRLLPNSQDSKLHGSLFSPVPTCNIADIIINYINLKTGNFTHYLIQVMILTYNIFSYSTLTYVKKLFTLPSRVFLQYSYVKWGAQDLSWSPTGMPKYAL